jgi:hypothetical protein
MSSRPTIEENPANATGTLPAPPKPWWSRMSRSVVNFWLDAGLLAAVVFLGWVSTMLQIVFPPPTAADAWSLWGLSFNQWRDVQFYTLCGAGLLALEHVVLHWNWVCNVIAVQILRRKSRPDEGNQAIYGVGAFILLVTLMMGGFVAALLSVKRPS